MRNIPNILTTLRLFMVPVYVLVFCVEDATKQLSASIFILASATDVLDGYIARRFNMTSKWGQLMDPLADKLMQITVLVSLVCVGKVPLWFLIYLAILEIVMILAGVFLYKNKIYIKSNIFGKANTVLLFIFMIVMLFSNLNGAVENVMLSFLVAFSFLTSAVYGYIYFLRHKKYKKYNLPISKREA